MLTYEVSYVLHGSAIGGDSANLEDKRHGYLGLD